jgi:hypothetical protein
VKCKKSVESKGFFKEVSWRFWWNGTIIVVLFLGFDFWEGMRDSSDKDDHGNEFVKIFAVSRAI